MGQGGQLLLVAGDKLWSGLADRQAATKGYRRMPGTADRVGTGGHLQGRADQHGVQYIELVKGRLLASRPQPRQAGVALTLSTR